MYLNVRPELKSQLALIPDGIEGIRATLQIMRSITRAYKKIPAIRHVAASLVQSLPQKAFTRQVGMLHEYVRDHIRYVRDVNGVETVQTPDKTMQLGYGDCDDKSVLLATLLESIGHPTRFVALALEPERFSHVIVETLIGRKWIALDSTEPQPPGWYPPGVVDRLVVYN